MLNAKLTPLFICLGLAACASSPSPEDVSMAQALSAQGKTLLAEGKNAEAMDIYLSATSRDENNARAWNGLGVSYDLLGKREKARQSYAKALEIAPQDPVASNNLAHLYVRMGDPAAAVRLLKPFANDKTVPLALKQNLLKAEFAEKENLNKGKEKMEEAFKKTAAAQTQENSVIESYADLGGFPTEGLAQSHLARAKSVINDEDYAFHVIPIVKKEGGIPTFTVRATGNDLDAVCDSLKAKNLSCVIRGDENK